MGLRLRKSIKLAPGLKINLSKSGVSLTAGRRGASVNLSSRGTRATVGLPGTGISYSNKLGGADAKAAAPQGAMASAPRLKKPVSLFGKLVFLFLWIPLCMLIVPECEIQGIVAVLLSIVLTVLTVKWINKRREKANAEMCAGLSS